MFRDVGVEAREQRARSARGLGHDGSGGRDWEGRRLGGEEARRGGG